jgi:hypothetical protein
VLVNAKNTKTFLLTWCPADGCRDVTSTRTRWHTPTCSIIFFDEPGVSVSDCFGFPEPEIGHGFGRRRGRHRYINVGRKVQRIAGLKAHVRYAKTYK